MNILFDLSHIKRNIGGAGIYSVEIVKILIDKFEKCNHEVYLLGNEHVADNIPLRKSNNLIKSPTTNIVRILYQIIFLCAIIKKYKIDLYFNPSVFIPFNSCSIRVVVIHDLFPLVFNGKYNFIREKYIKFITLYSLKNADCIFFVSNSIMKSAIEKNLVNNNYCLQVAPPSSNLIKNTNINPNYFKNDKIIKYLFVGAIEKSKNLSFFLKVWDRHIKKYPNDKFIISSGITWGNELKKIKYIIKDMPSVELLYGYKTENDLIQLYQSSHFIVLPSVYEGFGIPIIEGMFFGCIPIAPMSGGMEDILQKIESGLSSYDIEEWIEYIDKYRGILLNDVEKTQYLKLIHESSKQYTWEYSAQIIANEIINRFI